MPASMFIYGDDSRSTGHTSTCRETSASVINTLAQNRTSITTEMKCGNDKKAVVPLLEQLLAELGTRFPGVTATVTYIENSQWSDMLVVTITWTNPSIVAQYWWWATALQRIVLYSRSRVPYTDIHSTLENSSSMNSELWGSSSTKNGSLVIWDAIINGAVTPDQISQKMSGTSRGPVQAYSYIWARD